jgi:hypothetical protein
VGTPVPEEEDIVLNDTLVTMEGWLGSNAVVHRQRLARARGGLRGLVAAR